MARSEPRATEQASAATRVLFAVSVVGISILAFLSYGPPAVVEASAPPDVFSAARAMEHVRVIAREPHPTGSEEHTRVREYLLKELGALGLHTEVQVTDVSALTRGQEVGAITNVIAVREGSVREGSVLVVCHYDSVPWAPGAGDDGAAVGAALETARILAAGPPLVRDVVFLFTDAEELGLHGARIFVDHHPRAAQVGVVLNFEARGSRGPSIMFETAPGNAWFIDRFAEVVPTPVASSLADEVYERMPNDTDFSVFKRAGYRGYNFAFIEGLRHYHTPEDSVPNLDPRSVQHHGDGMLGLARHLGGLAPGVEPPDEGDEVYFNLAGLAFVHYREKWVWPLQGLALAVSAGALGVAVRRRRVGLAAIAAGLGVLIAALLASAVVGGLLFQVVRAVDPRFREGHPALDNASYKASFVALSLALAMFAVERARKRFGADALLLGQLVGWTLVSVAVAWLAPGGSFLFVWPTIALALASIFWPAWGARPAGEALSALPIVLAAALIALLWVPTLVASYQALTLALTPGVAGLVAWVGCYAALPIGIAAGERARYVPLAAFVSSLVFAALA